MTKQTDSFGVLLILIQNHRGSNLLYTVLAYISCVPSLPAIAISPRFLMRFPQELGFSHHCQGTFLDGAQKDIILVCVDFRCPYQHKVVKKQKQKNNNKKHYMTPSNPLPLLFNTMHLSSKM